MTKKDKHGNNNGTANGHSNGYVNGNGAAPKKADDVQQPGLLAGEYAKGKQQLMALINDLRSDGAALEVDLPTIVVAGNQSSGKSSLIEAISGINLPRASGTCTRVPTEVRLRQENKDWRCAVKIRWETDDSSHDKNEKPEIDFGPVIYDPALVEMAIRRAQLAILNPSIEPHNFVTYNIPDFDTKEPPMGSKKQHEFSRSVIVLEIAGPDVTDLTLVDLPGIIQNVSKGEDPNNITLVQDLVKSYIARDCLILLVITMKDDIQNQAAARLANEADPEGRRTIGVLTKVDTVQGRDVEDWVRVLKGEKEPLSHGYYVTHQPNADELADNITFPQARERERSFFEGTAPWNALSTGNKLRLGTRNLASSLSEQLLTFIQEKLPTLVSQINERHDVLSQEYKSLGSEPSNDPANEMLGLVTEFTKIIHDYAYGNPRKEAFMQDVNAQYLVYKNKIWATAPRFAPVCSADKPEVDVDGKPIIGQKFRGIVDIIDLKEGNADHAGKVDTVMKLDQVRAHVKNSLTRELPNNVPFSAKVQLIRHFTKSWKSLAAALLADILPIVETMLAKVATDVFASHADGRLVSRVQETINECVERLVHNTEAQLAKIVAFEERPFTQNEHYLNDMRTKILAGLRELRQPGQKTDFASADNKEAIKAAFAELAKLGFQGLKAEDLAKLRPTDEYEEELIVMAETRAFWQLAYKRTIDNIPQVIDDEFIIPIIKSLNLALIENLAIFDREHPERCRELLSEGPFKQRKREDLKQRLQRLQRAKQSIRNFAARG